VEHQSPHCGSGREEENVNRAVEEAPPTNSQPTQPAKTTLFAGGEGPMSAESAAGDFQPI
jgi:hypothetical protein